MTIAPAHTIALVLAVLVESLALSGCGAAATASFQSTTDLANAARIQQLFVSVDLGLSDYVVHGFEVALADRLSECGVQSKIVRGDPEAPDDEGVARSAQDYGPDAALSIIPSGEIVTRAQSNDQESSKLSFRFKLVDVASRKATWQATSTFEVVTRNRWTDASRGVSLATSVVARLRDDGVLPGCPAKAAGWREIKPLPGCREERRRILADAMRIRNDYERAKKLGSAPSCD